MSWALKIWEDSQVEVVAGKGLEARTTWSVWVGRVLLPCERRSLQGPNAVLRPLGLISRESVRIWERKDLLETLYLKTGRPNCGRNIVPI